MIFSDPERAKSYLNNLLERLSELQTEIDGLTHHVPGGNYALLALVYLAQKHLQDSGELISLQLSPFLIGQAGNNQSKSQIIESQEPAPKEPPLYWVVRRLNGLYLSEMKCAQCEALANATRFTTYIEAEVMRKTKKKHWELEVIPIYDEGKLPGAPRYVVLKRITDGCYIGPLGIADATLEEAKRFPIGTIAASGYKTENIYE